MGQHDSTTRPERSSLDPLLDEQSAGWLAGRRVAIADLLGHAPGPDDDAERLLELIAHELTLRDRAGESPELEEYRSRFPWLGDHLEIQFALQGLLGRGESARAADPRVTREAQPVSPPPGYEIEEEVGRGGMGTVFRARQLGLNRRVALKVVVAGSHAEYAGLERLRLEAEAVARLQHPNVVQIFEVGTHWGRPFLALEFVEGSTLARAVAGKSQPARRVAALAEILARADHEVHRRGIVHRDLKPANVLLTVDGIPRIADFGLARFFQEDDDGQTQSGALVGTPPYMAPEQARGKGKAVGPAADIYAMGAVVYELLTGRPPFKGETGLDTIQQVLHDEPVPPHRLIARVPRDLEIICLKCLEKEPHRRYPTAEALADDLNRFLADLPIIARPSSRLELAGRWCRRNPALAAASGIAIVALLGITVVSSLDSISSGRGARQLGESAANLREALRVSEGRREQNELRLAEEYLERGRTLGDRGDGVAALLVLARALQIAPRSAMGLHHAIRTHLGSLAEKLHRPSMVLDPEGQVTAVASSPDGATIAAGRSDGAIVLWSAQTENRVGEIRDHQSRIHALAFSPDGSIFCSGSDDGTARMWHPANGRWTARVLQHGGSLRAVSFSTDGSRALTGALDGSVKLWSTSTGRPTGVAVMHAGVLDGARFDPRGRAFVTYGGPETARLWNADTGQADGQPLRHRRRVQTLAFSPDGRLVLTGSNDGSARLWERASGKPVGAVCQHRGGVVVVVFSPTGEFFATASADCTARIWDASTTKPIGNPVRHELPLHALAFSPDGSILATGSDDQTTRFWDVRSGEPFGLPLRHAGQIWGVGFLPDGRLLSWGLDDPVRLWNLARDRSATRVLTHNSAVTAVAVSPDGKVVLTGASHAVDSRGHLQRWDAGTRRPIGPALSQPAGITSLAFSPDGKLFASSLGALDFGEARVWDVTTGEPVGRPLRHDRAVSAVIFTPDGKGLLTASHDRTVRLWSVATKDLLRIFPHEDFVTSLAISPDGRRLLTGSEDRVAILWDVETAKVVGRPLRQQGAVTSVALSPDGRSALTASVDHSAQLWETGTQRPIGNPLRHSSLIVAAAFSPDGLMALTASADSTLQLWATHTQRPIGMAFRHECEVFAAAFSRDGKTVLSGSLDATARLWPVPAPVEGGLERIAAWAQVVTGAELGESDVVRILDAHTWQQRQRRLEGLGGSPLSP